MARRSAPQKPSAAEQRRWRAESAVRDALEKTPAYKREVRRVEQELARMERGTQRRLNKGK